MSALCHFQTKRNVAKRLAELIEVNTRRVGRRTQGSAARWMTAEEDRNDEQAMRT
jgi:hypothetical protein